MSETLLIALIMFVSTILTTLATISVANWVNKKKVPAEVDNLNSQTRLSNGDLAQKYQEIANKQADENIDLNVQLREKEKEKNDLKADLEKIRNDLEVMNIKHQKEIDDVKKELSDRLNDLEKENEKLVDWTKRLVMQLQSFRITPTPYDIEGAKSSGMSLGEFGSYEVKTK